MIISLKELIPELANIEGSLDAAIDECGMIAQALVVEPKEIMLYRRLMNFRAILRRIRAAYDLEG